MEVKHWNFVLYSGVTMNPLYDREHHNYVEKDNTVIVM